MNTSVLFFITLFYFSTCAKNSHANYGAIINKLVQLNTKVKDSDSESVAVLITSIGDAVNNNIQLNSDNQASTNSRCQAALEISSKFIDQIQQDVLSINSQLNTLATSITAADSNFESCSESLHDAQSNLDASKANFQKTEDLKAEIISESQQKSKVIKELINYITDEIVNNDENSANSSATSEPPTVFIQSKAFSSKLDTLKEFSMKDKTLIPLVTMLTSLTTKQNETASYLEGLNKILSVLVDFEGRVDAFTTKASSDFDTTLANLQSQIQNQYNEISSINDMCSQFEASSASFKSDIDSLNSLLTVVTTNLARKQGESNAYTQYCSKIEKSGQYIADSLSEFSDAVARAITETAQLE